LADNLKFTVVMLIHDRADGSAIDRAKHSHPCGAFTYLSAMRLLPIAALYLTFFGCGDPSVTYENPLELRDKDMHATSPDGQLAISFSRTASGQISYQLTRNGQTLISPSLLGLSLKSQGRIDRSFLVEKVDMRQGMEVYALPWGEVDSVRAPYTEIQLSLKHTLKKFKLKLESRIFDDGVGFRYVFPKQTNGTFVRDTVRILEEHTQFNIAGDPLVSWGPGDWNSYENRLELTKHSEIDATKYDNRIRYHQCVVPHNAIMTPATMRLDSGAHLSIHEAALIDYPEMTLGVTEAGFESILVGSPNREAKAVRKPPFETPWRTISVGDRAIDLVANTLVLNLNEPNAIGDVSWFEPTTYTGVWWEILLGKGTRAYTADQTPNSGVAQHAANTENVKGYFDFCADNKIGGLLVEGWNTGWETWLDSAGRLDAFDFVTPTPDYDLSEVVAYGKSKGVNLIMHHETAGVPERYEQEVDKGFALMQDLELHLVKTGYYGNFPNGEYHHGQYGVRHYRKVLETAAKYQVAVDLHQGIKPTGERRTFPNAISAGGARGMEYNANGDPSEVNQPSHLPNLVYTRGLAGPFDYKPGIIDLDLESSQNEEDEVLSTLGKQLGAYVVLYSPIQMVADLPEHFRAQGTKITSSTGGPIPQDLLNKMQYHEVTRRYIRYMTTDWEATYPLAGELGKYAVVARKAKNAQRYFIGGIAGEEDQDIEVVLDFLPPGFSFELSLFSDAEDAHHRKNKKALDVVNTFVEQGDTLRVTMKQAGGFGGIIGAGVAL
jgi:hypothetical protein